MLVDQKYYLRCESSLKVIKRSNFELQNQKICTITENFVINFKVLITQKCHDNIYMTVKVFGLGSKPGNLSRLFDRAISSVTFGKNRFVKTDSTKNSLKKIIELRSYLKNFRLIILQINCEQTTNL